MVSGGSDELADRSLVANGPDHCVAGALWRAGAADRVTRAHSGPLADASGSIVVGVDLATAAVRVACSTVMGEVMASAESPIPAPVRSASGTSEQDPSSWWPAARATIRAATDALGAARSRIRAISVAATSGTVVLVGPDGEPEGPALMYDDRRATTEARIAQEAGAARWRALGLTITPTFSLAKVGWMARSGLISGALRVAHAADFLVWKLVGRPTPSDWSNSLKTGYDPLRGEWAGEALDALGVAREVLPDVEAPTSVVGTVCVSSALETGLPLGTEVVLGMTDGCAAQVACGTSHVGQFVTVLGTTLVVKGVQGALYPDPTGAVYSHRHPSGWWLPGGASNTGGEALSVFAQDRFPDLERAAARRGAASVVRYPLLRAGERFPFVAPQARAFDLGSPSDEVESFRSSLEGVAFVERLAYDHLRHLGMQVVAPILSAGGGSRSELWSAIRATTLGAPLARVAHPDTSFGACVLAAAGTVFDDVPAATAAMVREVSTIDPLPEENEALASNYRRFIDELARRGWIESELATYARRAHGIGT